MSPSPASDAVLLLVESPKDRAALVALLRELGHVPVPVSDARAAFAAAGSRAACAIIVDLAIGREALRLLRGAAGRSGLPPAVVVADPRRPEASAEALRLGAIDVLARPVAREALEAALANAVEYRGLAGGRRRGEASPEAGAAGARILSLGLRRLLESVAHLAGSRANVLIVGEPGSGRESLARALHARGPHAAQPLELLDCAHVRLLWDAAGGATRFERAVGGVLSRPVFLRDVHELPPPAQVVLERALAARESGEVAGGSPPADPPRVLASADAGIVDAVARRRFSHGLFARLSVVRIDVPPLRERPQDIPLLATEFLKEACQRHGLVGKVLTPAARTLLAALPWRGNADELRLLVERVALAVPRRAVLLEDVLGQISFDGASVRPPAEGTLRAARRRFERDYIVAVLLEHRGRVSEAARALGLERTNLYRKMKQLGIRPPTASSGS